MAILFENDLSERAQHFLQQHKAKIQIAIVCSQFNSHVTEPLLQGAVDRLLALELSPEHIVVTMVPGAIEIPVLVQKHARSGKFSAIIALGAVIRGETSHYDHVCDAVTQGCTRVSLDEHIPVLFGVLTADNDDQALARVGGSKGHKGVYCADGAIEMAALML